MPKRKPAELVFKVQSIEDEVMLDQAFPERERGGIHKALRAVLHKHERDNVEFVLNKAFVPKSYAYNPAALVQQLRIGTHEFMKAWRSGDDIHIRCTHENFANPTSWIGTVSERLMGLPKEGKDGRDPFLDIPWNEVPPTYAQIPSRIAGRINTYLQRCNYPAVVQCRALQNMLRIWLFKNQKPSRSHSLTQ